MNLSFSNHMSRPRINKILDQPSKVVCVIAGAGYGKTQAVNHYISHSLVRWVQLTESDNIPSRFWENLTRNVAADNPDLAGDMLNLNFPETLVRFRQFAEILKAAEFRAAKIFFVLDDFHLISSKDTLTFIERCIYLDIPNLRVIIISRKEPANMVSLLAKGGIVITEDELRFTREEIAEFLAFNNTPFSPEKLPEFSEATEGWALALQFLVLALRRIPKNADFALNTMKQNVFKLFETEAFNHLSPETQKSMVKLSLISDLPGSVCDTQLADIPFVWFNSLSGDYRVHPLYLEFLQSKQFILSKEEKREAYLEGARWCVQNNFTIDAINYFAKSGHFDSMVEMLFSYPFKLPHDTCEYFLTIFNNLEEKTSADINFLLLKDYFTPLMLIGMGKYQEAKELTFDIIRSREKENSPFATVILYLNYANLAYIDMYDCVVSHRYNAPEYIKKSMEYFKLLPQSEGSSPFSVPHIRSYVCLVGEGASLQDFDRFLEAAKQSALYISQGGHFIHSGYDDLAECEIAYYKNQPDFAKKCAYSALAKARQKNQYNIAAMAEHFLLRIATHQGDYNLAREILKQLQNYLTNPDFWNRQLLYDLITGLFYARIGLPRLSPSWLITDEKESDRVHLNIAELAVSLSNYIALEKYDQALRVLYNSYPRKPGERFLFSELSFSLMAAAAKIRTKDTKGAMEDFKRAYALSFEGVFEMPFIELGKNLRPLVNAALNQSCGIPEKWLKKMERKASVFVKKSAVIGKNFADNTENTIQLSGREREVLKDLQHGLSREEIAENQYLSVNTVKKVLQSIYIKLNAVNNVDAVRIAMEKKLIE